VGKWLDRLLEQELSGGVTAKTAERGLPAVLSVPEAGPAAAEASTFDQAVTRPMEQDLARFHERRGRLIRWGWDAGEADELADRLCRRDQNGDERVCCVECRHYCPNACSASRKAGLMSRQVGRQFAVQLQRCPAFTAVSIGVAVSSPKRNTRFNELRMKVCERWPGSARTPPAAYASCA
jgi:hypothetical protein